MWSHLNGSSLRSELNYKRYIMKNKLFYALFAVLMIAAFSSCKDKSASEEMQMDDATMEAAPVEALGKEHTSTYICPMHCEGSGSEEPGVCPVCQMEYVMNRNLEESHDGHDHGPEGHQH